MKFNVSSSALLTQLQAVNRVINSKNAMQILDNFLIRIEGDHMYITGSDQENVMTASVEITESEVDGAVAIPARDLIEKVKRVPNQGITFHVDENTKEVVMIYLNGQFHFMGVDAADYPLREKSNEDKVRFDITTDHILKGIETTLFAAATDTIRPNVTGIFWDIHENDITFVSTDTHKLVKHVDNGVVPGVETSFIMPAKPASILQSIIGKEPMLCTVELDSKGAVFIMGDIELNCRFINGAYPNYNRVIPQNNPFLLSVDRESLRAATERVRLCASLASGLVRMAISGTEVLLSSRDLDYVKSAEERVACSYNGDPMTIGFNSSYLIEILSNIKCDTIDILLSGPARPGIFKPAEQGENTDTLMLLMPMQVIE